jgi:hypothetical protein
MSASTKDKLEFTLVMGRHTRASLRQVEALLRLAATLQRLAEDDCNVATDEAGQQRRDAKKLRISNRVLAVCNDIGPEHEGESLTVPVFQGDPRGAVLKIRVPDGYTNDWGREGIVVPS